MTRHNLAGIAASLGIFGICFFVVGNQTVYLNVIALTVVFSGTSAALFLSFPLPRIKKGLSTARQAILGKKMEPEEMADRVLELAVQAKCKGPKCYFKFEKMLDNQFLKEGVGLLSDNYPPEEIVEILKNSSQSLKYSKKEDARLFQFMASVAPAFGVAGSILGLIGLLVDISNLSLITENIPIALISTLYGILLSNLIFSPVAENILQEAEKELLNQKLALQGLVEIARETHPYKLARKLSSHLPMQGLEFQDQVLRQKIRKYALQTKE